MNKPFFRGLRDGIPIALGYFSVSFGFGILCINLGLSILAAAGSTIRFSTVAPRSPPNCTMANGASSSPPGFVPASIIGMRPITVVSDVMTIGAMRSSEPSRIASTRVAPASILSR